ncbi:max dimerization protein 3 [Latimeria chalumnae]|uniref:max dimerization protein 3 n=1 Tax=Latimeria chalumnae TaxID=7897 RepID=UPI0003C17B38|nr:PREDICTED: max dimerization protein 3 [Latimeria chalumnae]|eukprot:XP_005992414.1 PREDICTED: max dimerization protein 3 [Latimeria chalumnae]
MDLLTSNIQVLLQAAEYLERREREAEHGYASILPYYSKSTLEKRNKQRSKKSPENLRSAHNELEKHRRAQLRCCLEQLKQHVPLSADTSRHTTLNLLRKAKLHIKKLEEQEQKAQKQKEKLRWEQQCLRQKLEQLLSYQSSERTRSESLGSTVSSDRSDSDREDVEVDVEGLVFLGSETNSFGSFITGDEHSYSNISSAWL